MPVVDVVQVAWHGLITDIDYPEAARIGLLIDHLGRVGAYAGDGGPFRHEWLHMSPPIFAKRLGQWMHVAASWSAEAIRLFIDGREEARFQAAIPVAEIGPASQLRIGAMAEGGYRSIVVACCSGRRSGLARAVP